MKVAIPDKDIEDRNRARLRVGLPPFTKEERAELKSQVGEVIIVNGDDGEHLLQNVLTLIRTNACGIIGLDSMSMIMPGGEAAKDLDDPSNVRARAQLLTEFQTRVHHALNRMDEDNETSFIAIDQVRANPDKAAAKGPMARFIPAYRTSTAYAPGHGTMMTVMVTEGAKEKPKSGPKKGIVVGKQFHWLLEKGSKNTHNNISGEVYYDYDTGVDLQRSVVIAGMQCGVIQESGSMLEVRNVHGKPILENVKGVEGLCELLRGDFQLELDVRQFILEANGKQCVFN
jgi:hypothetical protein